MRGLLAALVLTAVAAPPAPAQEADGPRLVARLNQNRIAITADFQGSEVFIYGAVAQPGAPRDDLGVVIRLAGPVGPVTVRRKGRVLGIWMNVDVERIDAAPSYYAVAASGPLAEALSHTDDLRHRVSLDHAVRLVGGASEGADRDAFLAAVVRLKQAGGLYASMDHGVELTDGVLFSAAFPMPADIVEGDYAATIFLTRDGAVIDTHAATVRVEKAGIERWLFDLSREHPLLYGLLALAVALSAGLAASEAFRLLKR